MGKDEDNSFGHLKNSFFTLTAIFFLAGCTVHSPSESQSSSSVSELPRHTVEAIPSNVSIPYFKTMILSGSALTFDQALERNDVYTKHAVSYTSNGLRITGVFLLPSGDGPFPLLIFNHGYIDPAVYTQGRGLKREQDFMARQGFAVFHTDYRGHAGSDVSPLTEKIYDGNLEYAIDSANAILAVRQANLPTVNAERVGMLGHSLGGGVTLAILTARPELVDAAVLYAPVHADVRKNFLRWRAKREEGDRTIEKFGSAEEDGETWRNLSPLTFLKNVRAPVLLFHGSKDRDVPKEWSDVLALQLKESSKKVTYIEYEGEGHEFSFRWKDFMNATKEFFEESLYRTSRT